MVYLKKSYLFKGLSLFAFLLVLTIQGCSNASYTNMIPDSYEIKSKFDKTVKVIVERSKANDHFNHWVPDGEVKKAIEESIVKSHLFSSVTQSDYADYILNMEITSVGNFWGLTAKSTLNTKWSLIDAKKKADVWKDVVRSEGVATVSDSFGGSERVRIMYERLIKNNIQLAFNQLSDSKLTQ